MKIIKTIFICLNIVYLKQKSNQTAKHLNIISSSRVVQSYVIQIFDIGSDTNLQLNKND